MSDEDTGDEDEEEDDDDDDDIAQANETMVDFFGHTVLCFVA